MARRQQATGNVDGDDRSSCTHVRPASLRFASRSRLMPSKAVVFTSCASRPPSTIATTTAAPWKRCSHQPALAHAADAARPRPMRRSSDRTARVRAYAPCCVTTFGRDRRLVFGRDPRRSCSPCVAGHHDHHQPATKRCGAHTERERERSGRWRLISRAAKTRPRLRCSSSKQQQQIDRSSDSSRQIRSFANQPPPPRAKARERERERGRARASSPQPSDRASRPLAVPVHPRTHARAHCRLLACAHVRRP